MKPLSVEDGITDERAVRDFFEDKGLVVSRPTENYPTWDLFRWGTRKGSGASELLMWSDARSKLPKPAELELKGEGGELDELLRTVRPATNEELIEQGNNLANDGSVESPEELPHRVKIALRRIMNRIDVIKNGGDFDVRDEQFIENELLDVWDHHSILPSAAVPVEERTQDHAQNLRYATQIAEYLHKNCYPEVTQWRPIPGALFGVLMPIDNMCMGVQRKSVPERTAEMEQLMGRESPEDAFRRGQELMRYNASRVATRYGTLIEAKDVANYPLFDYHAPLDHIEGKAKAVSQEVKESCDCRKLCGCSVASKPHCHYCRFGMESK